MLIFVLFVWGIGANWLAYNSGVYQLPPERKTIPNVSWGQVMGAFAIYLASSFLAVPILLKVFFKVYQLMRPDMTGLPMQAIILLQAGVMTLIFIALVTFFRGTNPKAFGPVWKDKGGPARPLGDFGYGLFAWVLCFPVITLFSEAIDGFLKLIFHLETYEQAAVRFFKLALGQPVTLIAALLTVMVLAPFIEEFLFRGLLQTAIKKRMGTKAAILLSAITFSLFHFSPSQGLGNITLILSFVVLGSFLGFLYEKRRSLWTSIGLHMAFNTISAIRIFLSSEVIT